MNIIDIIKSVFLGIVEGITEWLPISSTGHMILVNEFLKENGSFFTTDIFLYVIQLGAILAIITLYFKKLNPFSPSKSKTEKTDTWMMWFKVLVACIPTAVLGLLLNDFMEHFESWYVISFALIIYGVAFIFIEKKQRKEKITEMNQMTFKTALIIGLFQVLSVVPGTSRSGSTILGAMILGCSRSLAAEFSFFLAIPVMFGISFIKIITNDTVMTAGNLIILLIGTVTSYIVSLVSVKLLVEYVRRHNFKVFGYYRIILALIVILYFTLIG